MESFFEIIVIGLLLIMSGVALIAFIDAKHLRSDLNDIDADMAGELARVSRETQILRDLTDEMFRSMQWLTDQNTELKNHIEQLQHRANHNKDVWSKQFNIYSKDIQALDLRISSLEFKFQGHAATPDHTSDFGRTYGSPQ